MADRAKYRSYEDRQPPSRKMPPIDHIPLMTPEMRRMALQQARERGEREVDMVPAPAGKSLPSLGARKPDVSEPAPERSLQDAIASFIPDHQHLVRIVVDMILQQAERHSGDPAAVLLSLRQEAREAGEDSDAKGEPAEIAVDLTYAAMAGIAFSVVTDMWTASEDQNEFNLS